MPTITGFQVNGVDVGTTLDWMDKEYIIENYPEINNVFKQAGLWLWGYNFNGQLGNNTTTHRSSPVQTIAGGTNWKQVSKGEYHTAAIKTDGTLWTWGQNTDGQLGDNTITNRSSPVQTVSGGTNWKDISLSSLHALAIRDDSLDQI